MKKGNFMTQSVYFIHQPTDNTNRIMSSGALRLGYERHNYWFKRVSYFGGCDLAAGYDLLNVQFSPEYSLNIYGALGYEAGISFDISKNLAIGIQTAVWLKWALPLREIEEDNDWDIGMQVDPDILSFNLIFKFDGDRKSK